MTTKHNQILAYIKKLDIGHKISVRQTAKDLGVSEGTAYRAIKDAENKGYVSTIERIGTIRIEQKKKENFEKLTYAEIINIVEGQVLGGRAGLHKTLNKFAIGAMQMEEMEEYIEAGTLLIVGNRVDAHQLALEKGAAVLITGGFETEDYVKKLADELQQPIISTSYDTFTVATLINRAIYDQLIKKEIIHVEDILIPSEKSFTLSLQDKVEKWYEYNERTTHGRYPVIDSKKKVVGVVSAKDILNIDKGALIEKIMTKNPVVVQEKTSVASASRLMIWEGIEMLPVVDENNIFKGIISRQDVIKALQIIQQQPHVADTLDDLATNQLIYVKEQDVYECTVTPQMTNSFGTLSYGVFSTILIAASQRALREEKKSDAVVESMAVSFVRSIHMDAKLTVIPQILSLGRNFAKIDVEVLQNGNIVGKALLMMQLLNK